MFEPDNDTDDYTAVTVYINEEFAQVMAEEGRSITGTKIKNGTENCTEVLPEKAATFLMNYTNKKRKTEDKNHLSGSV